MSEEELCGQTATFRFTWPGQDERAFCVEHSAMVMKVANVIGLPLQLIPISYRVGEIPKEFPTCTHKKGGT